MRSLSICHLGKFYWPAMGGIETYVRTLARAQADEGARVSVLCLDHGRGPTRTEQDGPVSVTRCRRLASVGGLDACPGLTRSVASARADVLVLHHPNPTMTLALALSRNTTPLVVVYHGDPVRHRIRGALFGPIQRWMFRGVRAFIVLSPPYAQSSPVLREHASKVRIVPAPLDVEPFAAPTAGRRAAADALRARHAPPIWLACGRLVYYKGLLNAVRALPDVPGTLVIVGEGPERARLEDEARRLGVSARVSFEGAAPDAVPYFLAADALWFPSNARSEAFGIVQIEAMAAGCPVINTAIGGSGVPWVCRDGESGLTIPVDDPAALARASRRLLDEPGLRARLAEGGRARARSDFDARVVARRTLEVCEEAARERLGEAVA